MCFPFELQKIDSFKFRNLHSGAVVAWVCVLLMGSISGLVLNYFYDIMVGLAQQCEHQLFINLHFQLIATSMYIILLNGCLYYFKMEILLY